MNSNILLNIDEVNKSLAEEKQEKENINPIKKLFRID